MATVAPIGAEALLSHDELNGETPEQMQAARKRQAKAEDCSVDEPWPPGPSLSSVDTYVYVTTLVWLLLKVGVLVLPLFIFASPVSLVAAAYVCALPDKHEAIERNCGFRMIQLWCVIMGLPFIILGVIALGADFFFYYLFGVPLLLVRCCCSTVKLEESYAAIAPYRGGPSMWCHIFSDGQATVWCVLYYWSSWTLGPF